MSPKELTMARELPPEDVQPTTPPIDWSRYDTGKPWVLYQGVDFQQSPKAAGHAARQWGYFHGRRMTVRTRADHIIIHIHPEEGTASDD